MDNKKAVVVLAPNGRRQTVKVNPNSTILQILEEVCKKQGLIADEYDIKHHNKCLDTSTIIRFSGLPNNAQLELAQATKTRLEGAVIVAFQLEDGTRLTGSFTPGNSLWEVLEQLCPEETNPDSNLVVIYMRREVYGKSSFENTTLRSLGLTNGRAILRLIHRTPEELRTQANVATPLPSKPVEEKPYIRTFIRSESPAKIVSLPKEAPIKVDEPSQEEALTKQPKSEAPRKQDNFLMQFIKEEKGKPSRSSNAAKRPTDSQGPVEAMDVDDENANAGREKTLAEEDFVFLGARNAMIFSQETARAVPSEDLPDDFFELTINDAKKILRDMKKRRAELEKGGPLQTAALRNLQQSKQQLNQLNRYKQSIIRVNFPDHTVLQGTFNPVDTISIVLEFVREYLENKQMDFYLYTAPPKEILDVDSRLIEIGCVPNAVLHFGAKVLTKEEVYLRSDLLGKFTSPSVASLAAAKMRKQATRSASMLQDDDDELEDPEAGQNDVNAGASTSTAPQYEDYPPRPPKESEKVPKWFKPTK